MVKQSRLWGGPAPLDAILPIGELIQRVTVKPTEEALAFIMCERLAGKET